MSRKARVDSAIVILSQLDALKKKPFGALTPDDKRALGDLRMSLNRLPASIYQIAIASYDPTRPAKANADATEFKITTLPAADLTKRPYLAR